MSKLIVVTVSDDRMGRKEGLYGDTQDKIEYILKNNPQLGIDEVISWKWEDIEATDWYKENKILLDNIDAARNGRAYKPYIILKALEQINDGDYVVYTDCSPEMWNMGRESVYPFIYYNTDVIKRLCKSNNDILSAFIKWDNIEIKSGQLGNHFHRYFTLDRCIDKMGMREYENFYMGASGMWCIRKTDATIEFVTEWLKWNTDEDCASMGMVNIEDDYSFWDEEKGYKLGHRHDQSIAGLLLNKRGVHLIDIIYNDMNPYNFLQFCKTEIGYKFISSAPPIDSNPVNIGDTVENIKGVKLTVLRIEEENYIVGKSDGSCYSTTKDKLKKI